MNKLIKKILAAGAAVGATVGAFAADPTTMDGVVDLGASYLTKGQAAAIGAAVLSFGWVGFSIVKSYTKRAK